MRLYKESELFVKLCQVHGFEGESEGTEGEGAGSENDEGEEGEEEEEDDEGNESESEKDVEKLKEALRKERRDHRKAVRERDKLLKTQKTKTDKDESDAAKARREAEEANGKTTRLAAALQKTAVDGMISRLAGKMKFRDVTDALSLIDRSLIEVDQDEDEPAEVEIDEKSVEDALKALSKKKPHLLIASGDEQESGGNLGRKKTKDELDEEELKRRYPALR